MKSFITNIANNPTFINSYVSNGGVGFKWILFGKKGFSGDVGLWSDALAWSGMTQKAQERENHIRRTFLDSTEAVWNHRKREEPRAALVRETSE